MARLIDNVWLWGQTPNSHHACAAYNLPGVNRMTPGEGCDFFGIRNCCRVAMSKGPFPPFDAETAALKDMELEKQRSSSMEKSFIGKLRIIRRSAAKASPPRRKSK